MSAAALAFALLATFGLPRLEGHEERLFAINLVASVALAARCHGRAGAWLSTLTVAGASVVGTLADRGPFCGMLAHDAAITLVVFVALCAGTGWAFAIPRPATSGGRERVLPGAMLMVGIVSTMALWHYTALGTEARRQERFEAAAGEVVKRISERMGDYEQALRGARALFDASDDVSQEEWRRYVSSQDLMRRYPGVQAFGYAQVVEGPGGTPAGSRVTYVEPMSERNVRALGLDMLRESTRRQAMERARDSGDPALSGRVTLAQETDRDVQPGILLYVPVYRRDAPLSTPQERRAALQGWVYSPFRMHDLMRGIFGGTQLRDLALSVQDGALDTPDALLYADAGWALPPARFHASATLDLPLLGHHWTARVRSTPAFEAAVDTQRAQIVLAGGGLISLLLFGVVNGMARTRQEALELAERMSAARAQAEQRFRSFAESANESILVLGEGGRIDFCNRMATTLFGYTPQQISGFELPALLLLPPGFESWKKCVARGVPCAAFETRARTSHGALVPVEVSLGGWETEGRSYFSVIVHDISWRQAVSENLRKARGELRSILENIPAMVGSWDAQLRNRFCNGEYRDWFGIEPEEIRGRHIREVLGDKLYELNLPYMEKALRGERQSFERIIKSADGRSRHAQAYYIPDIQDGVVHGFFVLVFDISRQKATEQALESARETAESAARLKAQFLANMSHEIRTPMNAIMGMTRLTLDTPLDDVQHENLQMVEEAACSLLRILDDILDFSKMEAGKLALASADFDLREQLAGTLQVAASQAQARGLELVLDVAPDVPERLTGDAGRLMQVITNLCGNAIKFTDHGQVLCRVNLVPGAGEDGTVLGFEVIDSGVGIEPEAQARIFESFVQADSSITRHVGGTGLGLAICAQLVSLMHGRIGVDSEPGRGSRFHFTAWFERASPAPGLSEADAQVFHGVHAVLAVANEVARDALARSLRHFGLSVTPGDMALEAIAQARELAARQGSGERTVLLVEAGLWSEQASRALKHAAGAALVMLTSAVPYREWPGLPVVGMLRQPVRRTMLLRVLRAALEATGPDAAVLQDLPAAEPTRAPPERRLRILLAEDHPVNRKLAQRILAQRGHEVVTAVDGVQAVEATLHEAFDVIVMDVQMPLLDGEAAMLRIREGEAGTGRRTPIVALTAHALVGERDRLLSLGMDGYLSKPFQPSELIALVERAASAMPA